MAMVGQNGAAAAKPPPKPVRIPITNVWDGSAYSAKLLVGAGGASVNVMLDTGSSTLVVESSVYDGADDPALMITNLAQLITYGVGGFVGPVVTTEVTFGEGPEALILNDTPLAIAVAQQGSLGGVNGVMGLAYGGANLAWDLSSYLAGRGLPAATFPWPIQAADWNHALNQFQAIIRSLRPQTVTPSFDQLVAKGLAANRFAFYASRSTVSTRMGGDPASQARDPMNNGVFILGGARRPSTSMRGTSSP